MGATDRHHLTVAAEALQVLPWACTEEGEDRLAAAAVVAMDVVVMEIVEVVDLGLIEAEDEVVDDTMVVDEESLIVEDDGSGTDQEDLKVADMIGAEGEVAGEDRLTTLIKIDIWSIPI